MKFNLMRFTNIYLLAAMVVLTLTGVYGLFWTFSGWVYDIHRLAAWGLMAAIPWKVAISARSLRRGLKPNLNRGALVLNSLLLAASALTVLGLGLLWKWRLGPDSYPLRQTAISWHWMISLGLLAPFAIHVWRRWPRPKKVDFTSHRAFLKLMGLGAVGLVGWWLSEELAGQREQAASPRRFTGSRQDGLFSGNSFPLTHNQAPALEEVDPTVWRLTIDGLLERPESFTLEQLLRKEMHERSVTLDCTLGWYTTQVWQGISLAGLFDQAGVLPSGAFVRLESVTGYAYSLPMAEAREILLAHHVGGEPLSHLHGAPLRAVVPTRRGWFWVKWLRRIEVASV